MRRFRHGVVVGKFYPPHAGHVELIRAAATACERVSVVVAAASHESIPLGERVAWLGWAVAGMPGVALVGLVDDHPIDYGDPHIWDAHMAIFRAGVAELAPGLPVDAVFTGEDYGDELARRFGCTHVRVPRKGISGTAMRADLGGHWADLVEPARVSLAQRVVVVGAECTGTTTLAASLADHYGTGFVPEFGRVYTAAKLAVARQSAGADIWMSDLVWDSGEFTVIASAQTAAIDSACLHSPLVIADTDALATSVWHDRYVGGPHLPSLALAAEHPGELYLLTSPEGILFRQDGLRDGEEVRERMTEAFRDALESASLPWLEIEGDPVERLATSIAAVDKIRRPDRLAQPAEL